MNLFTPNTDQISDFYEKGKYILIWRLCVLFGAVFAILATTFINSSIEEVLIYLLCCLLSIISLLILLKTKNSKIIYLFMSISGTIIVMYTANNFTELVHIGDFLWVMLVVIMSFFGLGKKYGLFFLAINSLSVIYYSIFSLNTNILNAKVLTLSERISVSIELTVAIIAVSYVVYQFVIFHDYSYKEFKLANKALIAKNDIITNQNNEKTTLVQEIHHRVKNNLQIIVSLLRLQKNELKTEEAKKSFSEAINRIMVMSLIHQKLYKDQSLSTISVKEYLTELTTDILTITAEQKEIVINITSDIDIIGLKTIVPLGLMVNELVSNSIQHAFDDKSSGVIEINIENRKDNHFILSYFDSGTWKEIEEDYSSFGIELLQILASQLDGEYSRKSDSKGTQYIFTLQDVD